MIKRAVLNPVFANMLMLFILGMGSWYLFNLQRETFPNFSLNQVKIVVVQRGASPEEVEEGICVKIEEEIHDIEGIKKIESTAREGAGVVIAQMYADVADPQRVLNEIKNEVDKIEFADEADRPVVSEIKALLPVVQLAVYGDKDEEHLKFLAEEIKDDLLELPSVTQVEIFGTREARVQIQLSDKDLENIGMTFDDVVARVRQESLTLPAGSIRGESGEISIRTVGKKKSASDYADIVLLSRPDGSRVTLGQVALVSDGFEEDEVRGSINGQPAVQINVYKTAEEDLLEIAKDVHAYVGSKQGSLPSGVSLDVWVDYAPLLDDRLALLRDNLLSGLFLVFLSLLFFLGFRLSFWVTAGVPVSFLGALAILAWWGGTLNMSSTFAFILVVGMLVDDAIVVAENIYVHYQRGKNPIQAAIDATQEVWLPVVSSSMTTIAAFAPAFFIAGDIGKVMQVIPVIVGGALVVSLIESLLILPHHLGHSLPPHKKKKRGLFDPIQDGFERGMAWFVRNVYGPTLNLSLRFKGLTIGASIGLFILGIGMVEGGIVEFVVFPDIDTDYVRCRFELPPGTPIDRTADVAQELEEAIRRVEGENGGDLVTHVSTTVGATVGLDGEKGSHRGEIILALKPSKDGRPLTAVQVLAQWRNQVGDVPEVERFSYGIVDIAPAALPIEVRLIGDDFEELRSASAMVKKHLRRYDGTVDIGDDDRKGKLEYQFRLKPEAAAQGVTVAMVARQLRQGFFGETAVTVQRGREDVDVVVLFPQEERRHVGNLDDLHVRTPRGEAIPIHIVADRTLRRSLESIHRIDRNRSITVSSGIDETRNNAEKVVSDMEQGFFAEMLEKHPGVRFELAGQRGQTTESMDSLGVGFLAALGMIYAILVLTFRSFLQPFIIMSIIPLSFFGSIVGHWVFGYDLSMLSLIGFIGLAGVVVNDSLVLVEVINDSLAQGKPLKWALQEGGMSRFRAIFLTSSTTFMGLVPMLTETSGQAKFLIPMALTIAFGILFETIFVLYLIPSILSVVNDARRFVRWLLSGEYPTPESVEPAVLRSLKLEEEEDFLEEEVSLPEEIAAFGPAAAPPAAAVPGALPAGAVTRSISMSEILRPDLGLGETGRAPAPAVVPGQVTKILKRTTDADQLLDDAAAASENEDYVGALYRYLAALRSRPDRADIHFSVGLARGRLGDWRGAAASFERAMELEPENLDYREYRGWAALRYGNYEAAVRDFTARLEVEPENLLALKGRASALMALAKSDEAIADLDAALEMAPRNVDLYFLRGNAQRMRKRFAEAIEDYGHVLSTRPAHAKALFNRGLCHLALNENAKALADFDEASRVDPDLHEAILQRGKARLLVQEPREAAADFSAYLALRPDQTQTYYFRGKARSASGDVEGAVQDFETFLAQHPGSKRRRMIERFIRQHRARAAAGAGV